MIMNFSKKRKASKLIVLWVVFAMLIVPFVDKAGMEKGIKAAGNFELSPGEIDVSGMTVTKTESPAESYKLSGAIDGTTLLNVVALDGNEINLKDSAFVKLDGEESYKELTQTGNTSIKYQVTSLEILYYTSDDVSDVSTKPAGDGITNITPSSTAQTIYMYAKPDLKDSAGNDVTGTVDYCYIGNIVITGKQGDDFAVSIEWKSDDAAIVADKMYNAPKLSITNESNWVGFIGYGVKKGDGSITWRASIEEANALITSSGEYTCYVGLFSDKVGGTIKKEIPGNTVKVDKTAPVVDDIGIYYSPDGPGSINESNKVNSKTVRPDVFATDKTNYYIAAKITEEVNGSGIAPSPVEGSDSEAANVKFNVGGYEYPTKYNASSAYFYVSADSITSLDFLTTDASFTLSAKDFAGNSATGTSSFTENIDSADTSKKDLTVNFYEGSTTGDYSNPIDVSGSTLIYKNKPIRVVINKAGNDKTYIKVEKIVITAIINDSENPTPICEINNEDNVLYDPDATYGEDGLYSIKTVEKVITADTDIKLSNIRVIICKYGDVKINDFTATAPILYDTTAPTVTKVKLQQSSDSGATWNDVPNAVNDNAGTTDTEVHFTNVDSNYKYRYVVEATDGNEVRSGEIDKVYTNIGGTEKVFTGNSGVYYYELSDTDLALAASSPLQVTVYAKDKAGNVTPDANTLKTPKIQKTNKDIKADVKLVDANGNTVALDSIKYIQNDYKIRVTASSGYEINTIKLSINNDTPAGDYLLENLNDSGNNQNEFDSSCNRYSIASKDFVVPKTVVTDNEWLKNIKLTVEDTNTSKDFTIYDLLCDITEPTMVINPVTIPEYNQSYSFAFTATSGLKVDGTNDNLEAPLSQVTYSISDAGASNVTDASVSFTSGDKKLDSTLDIPESTAETGTNVVFNVADMAGNSKSFSYTVYVDKTAPVVTTTVNGSASFSAPLKEIPTVKVDVVENLKLDNATVTVKGPNGDIVTNIAKGENVKSLAELYGGVAPDGEYKITAYAKDKVNLEGISSEIRFILDRTKPNVSAKIVDGIESPKFAGFYNTNVKVEITCKDTNTVTTTVKDNGNVITPSFRTEADGTKVAVVELSGVGTHNITFNAVDAAGNSSDTAPITFVIDKTLPIVNVSVNSVSYNESMGSLELTRDAIVGINVQDTNVDAADLNYRVTYTKPDAEPTVSKVEKVLGGSLSFANEGDYVVEIYSIDKANNKSTTRTVSFRIDKTAPVVKVNNLSANVSAEAKNLTFSIEEAFWKDAKCTVNVYRKAGDGKLETLVKTIEVKPTAKLTTHTERFAESGEYRFEIEASDSIGHTVKESANLKIDVDKPTLSVSGVDRYDLSDKPINFKAEMSDNFYTTKIIKFEGTRQDIDGKSNKIDVNIAGLKGDPAIIDETFEEDGIYDITLTVSDEAGNTVKKELHFTIDTTAPVIKDLSSLNGKVMKNFTWDEDVEDLVNDLTVCETHMYLNGSEYDGSTKLEDGAYTLLITAVDEAGHESKLENVSFIIDSKAPTFIVTGVEDGDEKEETYDITVSLQLEEDTLSEVRLNDEIITIKDNQATLSVSEKGDYELYMKAVDAAGNESEQTIEFSYGKEKSNALVLILAVSGGVLVAGGAIFAFLKIKAK